MIVFTTPTVLPIEAAVTMGISVKETDSAIGRFGTGLKYAIAGILRLGGSIECVIEHDRYVFTTADTDIRGRTFRLVRCNDVPCGFTTDLGKHWEPWQIFRELASNTLDERGAWKHAVATPADGMTHINVRCREVEEAAEQEGVFLGVNRNVLLDSSNGATVYAGPSHHYYFRGIRAGSFGYLAPVTINVVNGILSEDRLLDLSVVQRELAWAFRSATVWDEDLILKVTAQQDADEFWCQNLPAHHLVSGELPQDLTAFLEQRQKWVKHPAFRLTLKKTVRKGGYTAVQQTNAHEQILDAGEQLCRELMVDVIPREKVHFTTELPDSTLAITQMDVRDVWFSTQILLQGLDEFLSCYLEEALHAMTGLRDNTREFQNVLLAMLVRHAARNKRQGPGATLQVNDY